MGSIDFDDLQWEKQYRRWPAYGRTKLANLLFMRELVRRLNRAGSTICAVAAHPGLSDTELINGLTGRESRLFDIARSLNRRAAQSAAEGALPQLYAATMDDVVPGDYFGPDGRGERAGSPTRVGMSTRARDAAVGRRLWDVSESLTGVTYGLPG
jgi:NAD(P)-dependent dehydrogenase (short-subunit alcohol dehydrogenase family)